MVSESPLEGEMKESRDQAASPNPFIIRAGELSLAWYSSRERGVVHIRTTNGRPVVLLTLAHAFNDSYTAFLATLMPLLIIKLDLSLGMAGILAAILSVAASLAQPLFGYLTDRGGKVAFVVLSPTITALAMSSIGLWSTTTGVAVAVAVGGVSTAIFHPQAASLVSLLSARKRGLYMSIFVAGGTAGVALGPPLVLSVVGAFGLEASILAAVPGVLISFLVMRYLPWRKRIQVSQPSRGLKDMFGSSLRPVLILWSIVVFRAWVVTSFHTFLPVHLHQGLGLLSYGWALALFMASESMGGLLGGYMSDRLGRRKVVSLGLTLAILPLMILLRVDGPWLWLILPISGVLLGLPTSVIVVSAQEAVPRGVATASGLTMGAGWAVGGLMVAPVGMVADHVGLVPALTVTTLLLLVSLALSQGMKPDRPRAAQLGGEVS